MKQALSTITVLILITTMSSGCLENGLFGNEEENLSLYSPSWEKGDFWESHVSVRKTI